jgi:chromosome segregation ATPase
MPNIQKQIESLKAEITRLEKEQLKAEQENKALKKASAQVSATLKDCGISFEAYISYNLKKVSRIVNKLEGQNTEKPESTNQKSVKTQPARKRRRANKAEISIKIPAGRYGKLPAQPEQIFEVKEKGPRPKVLKAYAEEIGLEAFLDKCRLN